MEKLVILLSLLLVLQGAVAQKQGHGNDSNHYQRTWHYEDHSIAAKGSFLLAKQDSIFIESNSKVIAFKVDNLSWTDRDFIKRKLRQIEELNASTIGQESTQGSFSSLLLGIIAVLMGMLTFFLFRASRKKKSKTLVSALP